MDDLVSYREDKVDQYTSNSMNNSHLLDNIKIGDLDIG